MSKEQPSFLGTRLGDNGYKVRTGVQRWLLSGQARRMFVCNSESKKMGHSLSFVDIMRNREAGMIFISPQLLFLNMKMTS